MASRSSVSESRAPAVLQRGGNEFPTVVSPAADTTAFWPLGNTIFHFASLTIWHGSSFLMLLTFQQFIFSSLSLKPLYHFCFLKMYVVFVKILSSLYFHVYIHIYMYLFKHMCIYVYSSVCISIY